MDEMLKMREYLNEGGRVLYTGKNAGAQFTPALGTQLYDPTAANAQCCADPGGDRPLPRHCPARATRRTTCSSTGSARTSSNYGAGLERRRRRLRRLRHRQPVPAAADLELQRPRQRRQPERGELVHHDERDPARRPRTRSSTSWAAAKYDRPGGPFDPHTGSQYVYSQIADVSYKRLTRTITVPATAAATSRSGRRTTPSRTGTTCSSRRTRSGRTTGRRCPT